VATRPCTTRPRPVISRWCGVLSSTGQRSGTAGIPSTSPPLAAAVVAGRVEVVEYLLSRGADPEERLYGDDRPLLDESVESGQRQVADLLLQSLKGRTGPVADELV
jgi:hypothetical protein